MRSKATEGGSSAREECDNVAGKVQICSHYEGSRGLSYVSKTITLDETFERGDVSSL